MATGVVQPGSSRSMYLSSKSETADYVVVGGGIVGVSIALELQQRLPGKKIVVGGVK